MPTDTSLYADLGVSADADATQIKAAFYAAVKTCHPDIDPSAAALDQTLKLLRAYQILADAERRKTYDLFLRKHARPRRLTARFGRRAHTRGSSQPETAPAPAPENRTSERRSIGPGLPASPSYQFAADRSAVRRAGAPWVARLRASRRSVARIGKGSAAVALVLTVVLAVAAVFSTGHLPSPVAHRIDPARTAHAAIAASAATQASASARQVAQAWEGLRPMLVQCLDEKSGRTGDDLYRQCVRARVQLHLLMLTDSAHAHVDRYKLFDALAEMRQAVGAGQIRMSSTQHFNDEVITTLATITSSATDERVRSLARSYYSCYTLKHCTVGRTSGVIDTSDATTSD
jgi:hypothetical protein